MLGLLSIYRLLKLVLMSAKFTGMHNDYFGVEAWEFNVLSRDGISVLRTYLYNREIDLWMNRSMQAVFNKDQVSALSRHRERTLEGFLKFESI